MKIRANLNFFLSKRGVSLKGLCEKNGLKTKEQLLGYLDDASVERPDESTVADLFAKKKRVAKKVVARQAEKPEEVAPASSSGQAAAPSTSSLESKEATSGRRRRRRRTKRDQVSSASKE
jgi:hypothetical protein